MVSSGFTDEEETEDSEIISKLSLHHSESFQFSQLHNAPIYVLFPFRRTIKNIN